MRCDRAGYRVTFANRVSNWLLGERFHLRTSLDEAECKRRIAQYSGGGFIPSVTDDPVAFFKWNRLYVGMPDTARGPWLTGKLRTSGGTTEVMGRAGVDYSNLWGAIAMETLFVWFLLVPEPADPLSWSILIVPFLFYLVRRQSRHGGRLIDFLQQLLDAEDVTSRKGDPMARA